MSPPTLLAVLPMPMIAMRPATSETPSIGTPAAARTMPSVTMPPCGMPARAHRGDGRRYHDRDEERRIYLHSVVVCEEYGEDALIEAQCRFCASRCRAVMTKLLTVSETFSLSSASFSNGIAAAEVCEVKAKTNAPSVALVEVSEGLCRRLSRCRRRRAGCLAGSRCRRLLSSPAIESSMSMPLTAIVSVTIANMPMGASFIMNEVMFDIAALPAENTSVERARRLFAAYHGLCRGIRRR